ncbi:hypothetical protein NQ314_000411 [Rhamnusium bicolor]|uniref:Uncharacterized protein n=1 Tax=Rhamnusium bicolor TaxID=1586634 RepID=A0AAV8ZV03_9CUCU|nr:hypothetical protein NQ314_000411 [Rhamnusium bicolor]
MKASLLGERQKFYHAVKSENESVSEFSARVKKFAANCKLEKNYQCLYVISLQFTLAKMLKIAKNKESALSNQHVREAAGPSVEVKTEAEVHFNQQHRVAGSQQNQNHWNQVARYSTKNDVNENQTQLSVQEANMKFSLVVLAGFCTLAISTPLQQNKMKVDREYMEKQKQILELFYRINQPSFIKEHVEIAKSWNMWDHTDQYTKPDVVKQIMQQWKSGMLPRGEIFSILYVNHMEEAIALFKMLYYAKDYQTFYKTAVWARENVNEGMFLYSLSVAIVHRSDTHGIQLPPIYEVYPHYFYSTEVIHQAYQYKQMHPMMMMKASQEQGDYKGYTIMANYSGHYLNLHPEQSMSYYLEDVGINAFYYYYNLYYPFWMDGEEFGLINDNRGEQYYYVHQQLLARYYLERLSNGLGEIPWFNWEVPVETPYYPSLQYTNGLEFPTRPVFAKLSEYFYTYGQSWNTKSRYGFSYSLIQDYERRINDAVDRGYVYTEEGKKLYLHNKDGMNILGNLIESNPDSPNSQYYGALWLYARHLLGYSYQPLYKYKVAPSALEHFETSLRDPMFYQLYKKNRVKVVNVEFDRLMTYFDEYYASISNAVLYAPDEDNDSFRVRTMQYRLNHKPFNYKVTVKSDKDTKAVVKMFLGPKYDEYGRYINISDKHMNMVQMDYFVYNLKSGENVITRNSQENYFYGPDHTSYHDMYKQVMGAYDGQQNYQTDGMQNYFYFPQRYMLPKGTYEGMPYQFYVIIYPYVQYPGQQEHPMMGSRGQYIDGYALGYPFDRHIKYEQLWYNVPNSYFYEAKIYHKPGNEVNMHYHGQRGTKFLMK